MRTLTIVVNFSEEFPPDWIWDAHKNSHFDNGVFVSAIAEGDLISNKKRDHDDNL